MMNSPELVLVHTTCPGAAAAERLAQALVTAHLAACVSIGPPVRSIYPWQGQIESQQELPVMIKTSPDKLSAVEACVIEQHDYAVPEFLVTAVLDGHRAYLDWAGEWLRHD